jgi:HPt (histidine-containing phosphotransfer) domain-containing protein
LSHVTVDPMESRETNHDGPLDRDHLRRMALGDLSLEREVLEMFMLQASRIAEALAGCPSDAKALAHTLKGSARAIGACGVADRAAALEAALGTGEQPTEALASLREAVADAHAVIVEILKNSGQER